MTISVHNKMLLRVEDLFSPGIPEKGVELIEGELVVMAPAGWKHNRIAYQFQRLFEEFCSAHPDLRFGFDNDGFLLTRGPDVVLSPDASLFRKRPRPENLPWMEFAPEIVVEVLSPGNNETEITFKRHHFFKAGSEQIWIAAPRMKTLDFFFKDGRRITFQGSEIAIGEGIADGLKIDLASLFSVEE